MNLDIAQLDAAVNDLKGLLKDGLLATDIWDRETGLSLAGHNAQPAAVALFTQVTNDLVAVLSNAGFPSLRRYLLLDLDGNSTVMVIRHGEDVLQGMLLNNQRANLGLLIAVALPRMLESVAKARL
ncbi:conserved hypothetical protein [Leptothrix cholodnii SP-6]|uniref:Roadblock/LC7 family protein n=1 Tax=Leptothrix cholodnii (strain ATCC 51168 / LMG 8142 / SP-6) TaxID=395495 RepID=B1Y4U8_LEPCP|nr:hypothetical protein [Leptothrix cholodnii]ACB34661.1 conserved hypothetical protein [Leptothrix cholodnii SP-6]